MYRESDIAYENKTHWVLRVGAKGFEVYRTSATHSTRCAIIGFQGEKGLSRAIAEADRRHALTLSKEGVLNMSLEEQLAANTAALKELTAALLAGGVVKNAQATAEAHSSPAVQAVVKAQKAADAKKPEAAKAAPADAAPAASGEPSAPTGESSSSEPTELQPWAEKTAAKFAELKDAAPDLDSVRKAVLGINALIGREQANAVLGRFGAQAVTAKDNKKGLDESQYADFFALCLEVLSGKVDATASMAAE